jgi:hypothetical protein
MTKALVPMEYGIKVTNIVKTQKITQNKILFLDLFFDFTLDDF